MASTTPPWQRHLLAGAKLTYKKAVELTQGFKTTAIEVRQLKKSDHDIFKTETILGREMSLPVSDEGSLDIFSQSC